MSIKPSSKGQPSNLVELQAVGTSIRTPASKSKPPQTTAGSKRVDSNPFKENVPKNHLNPRVAKHDQGDMHSGMNIIGVRLEDAKSSKTLGEFGNSRSVFRQSSTHKSKEEYVEEYKKFEEKHVVKKFTYSGGFKMPEDNHSKSPERMESHKQQQQQLQRDMGSRSQSPSAPSHKKYDDLRNSAGISKQQILQQLGLDDGINELQYDRLQDRVYETRLEEQLSNRVEDQVFQRIDNIHLRREELESKKKQIETEREKQEKIKRENWERLTGVKKYKPKYLNENEIEEEEFEESNTLMKEIEEYYTKKYDLAPTDRQKQEQEEQEESKKSYKEKFFEDRRKVDKSKLNESQAPDDVINKFFASMQTLEKPTLEETEDALELQSRKMKEMGIQWKNQRGIPLSKSEQDLVNAIEEEERAQEEELRASKKKNRKTNHSSSRQKSPLNIQSTVSHHGRSRVGDSQRDSLHENRVQIREEFNTVAPDYQRSEKPKRSANPYATGSSKVQQNNANNSFRKSDYQQSSDVSENPITTATSTDNELKEYLKFENEFVDYLKNRKKEEQLLNMSRSHDKKDFELYESTSPNQVRRKKPNTTAIPELQNSSVQRNRSSEKLDANAQNKLQELKMIQTIFDKIDKNGTGMIDKLDAVKCLLGQKQIISIYDLTSQNLNKHIQSFPCATKGFLTFEEFAKFLLTPRDIFAKPAASGNYFADEVKRQKQKAKMLKQQTSNQKGTVDDDMPELNEDNSTCLLQPEHLRIMRELYQDLDKHNDMIVNRKQFVEKLRMDVRIVKILHLAAVYMPSIDKTMTVDRVLLRIEQEEFLGTNDVKASKEYITWAQFLDYFNDMKTLKRETAEQAKEKIKQIKVFSTIKDNIDDQNETDLDEATKNMLRSEYDRLPKQQEQYVSAFEFIENVKMNQKYPQLCNNIARRKADKFDLQEELLCDVLDRMETEADEFLDLEEIFEYFSRRGRPRYAAHNQNEDDHEFKQKLATAPRLRDNTEVFNSSMRERRDMEMLLDNGRKSQLQDSKGNFTGKQNSEDIDGYDSDPETHTFSRGIGPGSRKNLTRPKSAMNRSNRSLSNTQQGSGLKGLEASLTKSHGKFDDLDQDEVEDEYIERDDLDDYDQEDRYGDDEQQSDYEDEERDQLHIRVGRSSSNRVEDHSAPRKQHINDNGRSIEGERGNYKKAMLDYYQSSNSKAKRFPLTQPEPYEFDKRDSVKPKTIRQRKVEEMIKESKEREENEYKIRPKPKEVPDHVKKPLYEKIKRQQEKRRQEVRANSVAITLQREKPFKFYTRDNDPNTTLMSSKKSKKKTHEQRESFVFQANKVPWFCSTNLLEKINREEELKRQERVAKQAQKTMSISKLPPRMEKHEQERKARELMEGFSGGISKTATMNPIKREMYVEPTFQPPKAKAIPNFEKMHSDFQDKLDKQRKGKRPTETQPFHFQESRKMPARDYMDQENEMMKSTKMKPPVDKLEEAMKWRNHKPKYQPPSIKKWEQNIERIKKEKEEKYKKTEEDKKAAEARQKKKEILAVEVREKFAKTDTSKAKTESVNRVKQEFKRQEEEYLQKKAEIAQKIKQRPLLMETKCRGRAYLEKLKTLDKIDTRLKEKGMASKDRLRMYTKDEIKMLGEIKALKARGFKSFRNELQVGDDVSLSPPKSGSDYDYDKLENEFGDDDENKLKPNTKKTQRNSAFEQSGKKAQNDDSKLSFLHNSTNADINKKKLNLDELNSLMDSQDDIQKDKRTSIQVSNKNDRLLKKVDSLAQSEDDYNPRAKKEGSGSKEAPKPAAPAPPAKKEEPSSESKKEALKKMKFDSIGSDNDMSVEEKYDEDFDD